MFTQREQEKVNIFFVFLKNNLAIKLNNPDPEYIRPSFAAKSKTMK